MPSRKRLDRLWSLAEEARDRGRYRLARRLLRILHGHDPDPPMVRLTLLEVMEVRGLGPEWQFISMSSAKIDRVYAADGDDPAEWVVLPEPESKIVSDDDLVPSDLDIRESEDVAEQWEERLRRRRRGKERWRTR